MFQITSKRRAAAWGTWGAMSLLWLAAGCTPAGPDFTVSPQYHPSQSLPAPAPAGNKLAVRVEVIDARTIKPETRPDGREVLASGDKGKVFLDRPATRLIENSMTSALQAAGFNVTNDAAVVVEVDLVELPVEAYQFTHWNLPTERASTLDALGAVLPGPVRETRAKTSLNVVIRKHDTRLGFSHIVGGAAANSSTERGVVEQTVSQAINQAVDEAVAKSAPDVEIVTRTPVTRREIDGREEELLNQQKEIKDLGDMLARREAALAEDRKAVEDMRRTLVEDQRTATQTLAADRKALREQQIAMEQEHGALVAKLKELTQKSQEPRETQKPQETPEFKAAMAAAQKQQADLDARGKLLDERERNLAADAAKLQDAAAKTLAADRKALQDQRAAMDQERGELKTKLAQLALKSQQTPDVREALAAAQKQQADLDARAAALGKKGDELEARARQIDERERNLAAADKLHDTVVKKLAADRKALEEQRVVMEQERTALKAKLAELAQQSQKPQDNKEALAVVEKQLTDLNTRAVVLGKKADELDSRGKLLDERERNLTSYAGKLEDQAVANRALSNELAARQKDLTGREKALETWKKDLDARAAARPPVEIVQKRPPLIIITDPAASHTETTLPQINISGVAIDDRGIVNVRATVNGQPLPGAALAAGNEGHGVGIQTTPVAAGADGERSLAARRIGFAAPLKEGNNEIVVEAVNSDQLSTTQKLSVIYDKGSGRIHIISIGINDYQNRNQVPPLRYAVSDAKDIAETFERVIDAPTMRVRELLNGQATRANVSRQLFEQLPSEVRPSDTVVIFFSGHGAPDTSTDSHGNVETFLLPIDADPDHLFATAIRMNDVGTIMRRLRSERIVFMADTCYSGAAAVGMQGARTLTMQGVAMKGGVGIKAIPQRPAGKGVAIMTASTGIQIAQEKVDVHHGIFTYYLLQGLNGAADSNHDGKVTVDELYDYVRDSVSKSTGGKQVPQISRDPTAGEIVLSNVPKPAK